MESNEVSSREDNILVFSAKGRSFETSASKLTRKIRHETTLNLNMVAGYKNVSRLFSVFHAMICFWSTTDINIKMRDISIDKTLVKRNSLNCILLWFPSSHQHVEKICEIIRASIRLNVHWLNWEYSIHNQCSGSNKCVHSPNNSRCQHWKCPPSQNRGSFLRRTAFCDSAQTGLHFQFLCRWMRILESKSSQGSGLASQTH